MQTTWLLTELDPRQTLILPTLNRDDAFKRKLV